MIKNYTSTVPAATSIKRIEEKLVKYGAKNIMKFYEDYNLSPVGIIFEVIQNNHSIVFKLPAKVAACKDILISQIKKPRKDTIKNIEKQAERTAWKIIYDWVNIQISLIELGQAEFIEVFLPYVYELQSSKTFYEAIKENQYKALISGRTNENNI